MGVIAVEDRASLAEMYAAGLSEFGVPPSPRRAVAQISWEGESWCACAVLFALVRVCDDSSLSFVSMTRCNGVQPWLTSGACRTLLALRRHQAVGAAAIQRARHD
jgi:hypothetical protein